MDGLRILSADCPGFTKIVDSPNWTVGLVNYTDILHEDKLIKRERHFLTDELFILVQGDAFLYIGVDMEKVRLQIGEAYLVEKGTWHGIALSKDAKVFVVENSGTNDDNSEKFFFKDLSE